MLQKFPQIKKTKIKQTQPKTNNRKVMKKAEE